MSMDRLILIGVRHHSPACARLVRETIETRRPAFVLIEGPADYNPHIDDLRRAHMLPIAIFTYHADETMARASYSPFCGYSPEWLALQAAWSTGATPLFCDLPSWHPDFGNRDNRYADPSGLHRRYTQVTATLEEKLGAEGGDAAWDALIEQREEAQLPETLARYFELIRPDGAEDPREAARDSFMGRYAAWALRETVNRPVVLVCGGWHVSGIRAAARTADGERPPTLAPAQGVRADSYLTPFSYMRLDSFTGYASGMPSPAYYEQVHMHGLAAAAEWAMGAIAAALRKAGLPVSTADRIAWHANTLALARLRGHVAPLRADVLDAALGTLVKDALSRPAAWTGGGTIQRGADDIVVAMLRALSGDGEGQLAVGTRQPPLIADIDKRLAAHALAPGPTAKRTTVDWREPSNRPRAQTLHQLQVLELPGITRRAGPSAVDERDLAETFEIVRHPHWHGAIIEASRWGGELPMAAAAKLKLQINAAAGDMPTLAAALSQALFAGLLGISRPLVADLAQSVSTTRDIGALGKTGQQLGRLYRYGDVFGPSIQRDLAPICEAAFARTLWLCEAVGSDDEAVRAIPAVIAARDFARDTAGLMLDLGIASGVFARLLANPQTPPALAGAAVGYTVALGDESAASPAVRARVRGFGTPQKLGDFLAGLFALARESMRDASEALDAVDALIADWSDEEFLAALPSLRGAFAWFPPRERESLARLILQRAGFDSAHADALAIDWMRQRTRIADQAAALALEARVTKRLARYGLS